MRRYHRQFQPYQIRHTDHSIWQLATTADDFQTIEILPSSVITVWVIVLHFRIENGNCRSLAIINDALNDKDYRALAVALKITGI